MLCTLTSLKCFIATEQFVKARRTELTSDGVSLSNLSWVIVDVAMVLRVFFVMRPKNSGILSLRRAFCNLLCLHTPNQRMHLYIYNLRSLIFTLKHLQRSCIFRTYDHPQGTICAPGG